MTWRAWRTIVGFINGEEVVRKRQSAGRSASDDTAIVACRRHRAQGWREGHGSRDAAGARPGLATCLGHSIDDPVDGQLARPRAVLLGPSLLSLCTGSARVMGVYVEAGNEAGHLTLSATVTVPSGPSASPSTSPERGLNGRGPAHRYPQVLWLCSRSSRGSNLEVALRGIRRLRRSLRLRQVHAAPDDRRA